ncbi:excinuclease ABC subunit UvrA [Paenibacillus lycopersici]|uniref:UvrABC system protein A n=1 Tax=Paenibacillus lycopersici TaxID=2704462 RepID=A0A6C0G1Y7_9BACL|nr:excinuclease ABC subunit UvrA [Paenibacillus lycopersici]QHT62422.1 excinuclease ABC subunit UvrA [Paenibacillus lycopersici]
MRQTISIRGARENNLKNVSLDIPREKLTVVTGVSGSGKSSLAFDVIYGEGQRRFMESISSSYAKRYIPQLKKPDVDFVYGLSPVVSIEQKTGTPNPRSTVGTMSDVYDYVRLLFATLGTPHCPRCAAALEARTPNQIAEHILALPAGSTVELYAPVQPLFGETYSVLFDEIRTKGYRMFKIDGILHDTSDRIELDEHTPQEMEVLIDKYEVKRDIYKQLVISIELGMKIGEGFLHIVPSGSKLTERDIERFQRQFACKEHHFVAGELSPGYFTFNDADSACRTCLGIGAYKYAQPELMIANRDRSLRKGALNERLYNLKNPRAWRNMVIYSLSRHYGFSLDTPFRELPPHIVDMLFYGTKGERYTFLGSEDNHQGHWIQEHVGKKWTYEGIVGEIDRWYRNSRKKQELKGYEESMFNLVMVEQVCPECHGMRFKPERLLVTMADKTIHDIVSMPLDELKRFLLTFEFPERKRQVGTQIMNELLGRIDLLLDIGLGYLNLDRRSDTLSGGEAQRIRLSTQIGSGLMGMLYVLDEPSIGLHPRDSQKMIDTLKKLRDSGNTVIVVEHDVETMMAADHVIEIGPGPGQHGGNVVAEGTISEVIANPESLTGQFLSGTRSIVAPAARRSIGGKALRIVGARENTLKDVTVDIPLGVMTCVTGVSGSGKSSLINDVLYKALHKHFQDARIIPGLHERIEGLEQINGVINIDQSPIGRMPTSSPATYVGLFDRIRKLYASLALSVERGYTETHFSFNAKGGRCEECKGHGTITSQLLFMADVESVCPSCKGARFTSELLDVTYNGKTIADVLEMSIEDAEQFFQAEKYVAHKLKVLNELGVGYLKLGHSATVLSGGEAQRIKLAAELGKMKRGAHYLYIFDEPTTGLHLADIQKLLDCMNRLLEAGHTVLVIEHHLDVIKTSDHVIDMGPEAGRGGGYVVAAGTPEEIAQVEASHTGRCLREFEGFAAARKAGAPA